MTPHSAALGALLLAVAFTHAHVSTCQLMLKGSVSCLDCTPQYDLSGVRLAVKCSNEKKPTYALTDKHGNFVSSIPMNSSSPSPFSDCQARILGGPVQICARKRTTVSKIIKVGGQKDSYGLSNPLTFFTKCPSQAQHPPVRDEKAPGSGSPPGSAGSPPTIIGFPPPANWSGVPLIYLFPFIPIIGIP